MNSGLEEFGTLYLLDTTAGAETLERLDVIAFENARKGNTFASVTASVLRPSTFSAGVTAGLQAKISATLKNDLKLELTNVTSETVSDGESDLIRLVNQSAQTSGSLIDRWSLKEAAAPKSPLRLLLIIGTRLADSAEFTIGDGAKADASLTLADGKGGNFNLDFTGTQEAKFKGNQIPTLHNYRVFRVTIQPNESGVMTYHFITDKKFDISRLPAILKSKQH